MEPGDKDELGEDSWSEASEGEQQAWLRSALIESETKPVEVDPRYEIPIEPVDFTTELDSCTKISFDMNISPRKRNAEQPTHCSVSASMPSINFKMFNESVRGKVAEAAKLRTYPRRKSSEGQKRAKKKHTVPGFMRETEAWSKRRSISGVSIVPVTKTGSVQSALKRSISNSMVSKSVCAIPSRTKSTISQSELSFKSSKPRLRSPTGLRGPIKQKAKQPLTKCSIHFPILRESVPVDVDDDDDECVVRPPHGKHSSKHWDQILLDPERWSSNVEVQSRSHPCSQNRLPSDISAQSKGKVLSVESFNVSVPNQKTGSRLTGPDLLDFDNEMADDTCLIGFYNDEENYEDTFPRVVPEPVKSASEVEQLRKALSDVSLMYQDQVQSLKRQLFSTLEQFEYDRKQIAFLKRKLAENSCTEHVRGR